ncbi:tetratricopeptide repeat protein [Nocardia sp. ET3-3]|uniref:Tetratricopeptide repeat protein n=1 Tax=Nocardia terrae TaxID=2675851 RepID=A0A7K1UPN7_9NOCA|nr:tetratricopeptide repeat protein [Nocardia terrae]MVU75868.1 tetratricopeptide repeat protein [Nocardia terrae]
MATYQLVITASELDVPWFAGKRRNSQSSERPALDSEAGTHAAGARSVAIGAGSTVGTVQTGDGARVVNLPPEALRPIAEVDAPPGIDNLPVQPTHFVGRERELARLDAALSVSGPVLVQAVHGLGGIGKTTLVAQWAATRDHGHEPLRWITADTSASVERGLAEFATALQPMLAHILTVAQLAERALQWLSTHSGWLLVLDNVENQRDIAEILARAHGGRIVITSRRATGWHTAATIVRIDVLDPTESVALLIDAITADGPRQLDGASDLCTALGHLPLAIDQAGAYLAQNPLLTPHDYLTMLSQYPADMFEHGAEVIDPERTIARIWNVTLDRVTTNHPTATNILQRLAWFAPEAIPVTLFDGLAAPPAIHSAIGALTAYNMISADPGTASVSVHRLVQAVARTPDPDDPRYSEAALECAHADAAAALLRALPERPHPSTWATWRTLLPHVDTLVAHHDHDINTNLLITTTDILNLTGEFLDDQGSHERAIEYIERALINSERTAGTDHPRTLTSRNNLALAYRSVGRFTEAIPLYERTLADRERILGINHLDTLSSRNNLADAYRSVGRFTEAIPLYERALADSAEALGNDHPSIVVSRNNLASAYESTGRLTEAIQLFELTIEASEQILGIDHPTTLTSRNNLAAAYQSSGRLDEAIRLFERTLEAREQILGFDHPDTLTSRNNLAAAYQSSGRLDEAIRLFELTIEARERIQGIDHPHTLTARNNLATAYMSSGRLDEALSLLELALTECERLFGTDHPDTFVARCVLAEGYEAANRLPEACRLYERVLADTERAVGPDHRSTHFIRGNLARLRSRGT